MLYLSVKGPFLSKAPPSHKHISHFIYTCTQRPSSIASKVDACAYLSILFIPELNNCRSKPGVIFESGVKRVSPQGCFEVHEKPPTITVVTGYFKNLKYLTDPIMEQTTRAHKPNRPLLSFDNDNVYAALTYKGKRTEIKISPHSVSLASPVWKKALLFPTLPVMQNDGPKPLPDSLNDSKSELAHEQPELDNKDPEQPKLDDKDLEQPELDDKDLDEFELVGDSLGSTGSLDYPTHGTEDQYGQDQKQVTARKILDLTEDDAESILLLLRIAHLQFHKIPRKLSFCSLVEVAILCDYYDCINLVRPWYEPWLENTAVESQKPGQEMWLLIAHVFGEWKVFRELATKLVQEVTTNDKLECLTASGKVLTVPLPLDIVGKLTLFAQPHISGLTIEAY